MTTNLAKLTEYFKDMAILMIVLADARSNKQVGIAYVKMKTYIVNNLLSELEEKIEIVVEMENKNKKIVIG